jgi:hypothetical protein
MWMAWEGMRSTTRFLSHPRRLLLPPRIVTTTMRDASTSPLPSTSTHKRTIAPQQQQHNHAKRKKRPKREFAPESGSSEDVLWRDVVELLGGLDVVSAAEEEGWDWQEPLERGRVVQLDVVRLSSTGARGTRFSLSFFFVYFWDQVARCRSHLHLHRHTTDPGR